MLISLRLSSPYDIFKIWVFKQGCHTLDFISFHRINHHDYEQDQRQKSDLFPVTDYRRKSHLNKHQIYHWDDFPICDSIEWLLVIRICQFHWEQLFHWIFLSDNKLCLHSTKTESLRHYQTGYKFNLQCRNFWTGTYIVASIFLH